MEYFPLFMDLRDQPVLLVGAGSVAERKARMLLDAGAELRVVAREMNGRFLAWQRQGRVRWLAKEWREDALSDVRLVVAATPDRETNLQVHAAAERARLPVNVVDDRALCRFIMPAIVNRGAVQVAVSSAGTSPVLARRVRGWIERLLPAGIGRVAEAAGRTRAAVRRRLRPHQRRGFWEGVLSEAEIRRLSVQPAAAIARHIQRSLDGTAAGAAAARGGRVSLVGAGPGRAELLTLRALHVLEQADVILHDGLVSAEILELARRDADRVDVGKRAGAHHRTQQQIHERMVEEARRGRHVVRLKGGDPFIFGRGGEEIEYLRLCGIPFEVVPGVTAANGCAAYAGIPLTHRDFSQTVTFVTGHPAATSAPDDGGVDWAGIVGPGRTAVVYMGVRRAPELRDRLLAAGIGADLPVALIVSGTLDHQRILHGRVADLPRLAAGAPSGEPGLLVIGQVAALGSNLGWFPAPTVLQPAA